MNREHPLQIGETEQPATTIFEKVAIDPPSFSPEAGKKTSTTTYTETQTWGNTDKDEHADYDSDEIVDEGYAAITSMRGVMYVVRREADTYRLEQP